MEHRTSAVTIQPASPWGQRWAVALDARVRVNAATANVTDSTSCTLHKMGTAFVL